MDLLLKALSYSKYRWKICGDLEVIGLLLGMQPGYTKFCCLLCEWDSQAKDKHYKIKDWPMRENSFPREVCQKSTTSWQRQDFVTTTIH